MDRIGKYEILEKIGTGGFGVVFKGYDPFIKRPVAVKTCFSSDETVRQRFFREAEIAGRLQHRHITQIYDFGFHQDVPFLVVEYLTGEDLRAKIKRREELPLEERLRILVETATGLEYAHGEGVIHRDIKPANVRVLDDGSVKIMDFGTARFTDVESNLTQTGVTIGTVAYLSPEQVEGKPLALSSDIFSFGILAYELLAYQRPFRGKKISEIILQILEANPSRLREVLPGCPPDLEAAVHRCLEREPSSRYQTLTPLIADFEAVRASLKGVAPAPLAAPAPAAEAGADRPDSSGLTISELLLAARPLLEQRDYDKAEGLLRQALAVDPDHEDARRLHAALEQDRKEQTEAGRRLQGIVEAVATVESLIERRDFDRAGKALKFAVDLFGSFDEAEAIRRKIEEARSQQSREDLHQRRLRVEALLSEARLRLRQLLASDAHRYIRDALRIDPEHKEALRLLKEAEGLLAQGDAPRENATRDAVRSIEAFLDRGDHAQAEKALEFARHHLGDFPQARDLRSRITAHKKEVTRVSRSQDTVEDIDSFLFLARELLQVGELDGARRALRRVLRLNPEHGGAKVLLAELRDRTA